MNIPTFVVVGNVNRGKTSVISTLAADESLEISNVPGTTRECGRIIVRVDDQPLFQLIDTPGFERPRHVADWLKQHETTINERQNIVAQFVAEHAGKGRYEQECRLLQPILDGGAIIYIVDGSVPITNDYLAEMQILRWTGQPSMAVINRIHEENYISDWQKVLQQYFGLRREFNAHKARFEQRVQLIRAMSAIDDTWQVELEQAADRLTEQRQSQQHESARAIANMLIDMLQLVQEENLGDADPTEADKQKLQDRFKQKLRQRELQFRVKLQDIYGRSKLEVEQEIGGHIEADLFNPVVWKFMGLSQKQLAMVGLVTGALAGGAIDATVGAASFLLGTVIGGGIGAAGGYFSTHKLARVKIVNIPLGGKILSIGPISTSAYPWVVLDRALVYHRIIANTAHAYRGKRQVDAQTDTVSFVKQLPQQRIRHIEKKFFTPLRKRLHEENKKRMLDQLTDAINALIQPVEKDLE